MKQIAVFIESNKKGNINKEFFRKLLEKQQEIALKWFKRYDIPVIKEAIIDFNKVKISNVVVNNKKNEVKPKKEKKEVKKENKVEEVKPKNEVKEKKVVKKTVKKVKNTNNKKNMNKPQTNNK